MVAVPSSSGNRSAHTPSAQDLTGVYPMSMYVAQEAREQNDLFKRIQYCNSGHRAKKEPRAI